MVILKMAPAASHVLLLLLIGFQASSSSSLVMKSESEEDTVLYEGPPSLSRKGGKALPSTIIVSSAFGIMPKPKPQLIEAHSKVAEDFPIVQSPGDDQDEASPVQNETSKIKFYKIECSSGKPCTSIIPSRVRTQRPQFKPYSLETIMNYLERQRLANREGFLNGTPSWMNTNNRYQNNRVDRQAQRNTEETYIGDFRRYEKYIPGFTEAIKGQIYKFQHILSPEIHRNPGKDDTLSSEDRSNEDEETNLPTSEQYARPIVRPWSSALPPAKYPDYPTYDNVLGPASNIRPTPPSLPSTTYQYPSHLDSSVLRPNPQRPQVSNKGKWTRRVTTSVAQLDRDTGEWVKISSNDREFSSEHSPNAGASTLRPRPKPAAFSMKHHASVGLHVLGANERRPHSYSPSPQRGTHVDRLAVASPLERRSVAAE